MRALGIAAALAAAADERDARPIVRPGDGAGACADSSCSTNHLGSPVAAAMAAHRPRNVRRETWLLLNTDSIEREAAPQCKPAPQFKPAPPRPGVARPRPRFAENLNSRPEPAADRATAGRRSLRPSRTRFADLTP